MEFFKKHAFLCVIVFDCLLIAFTITVSILKVSKNAFVEIAVTPLDATLTIDGKVYENNSTVNFYPGTYHFKLEKEGLETKEEDIELVGGYTIYYSEYLTGKDGDLSYYLTHPEDYMFMNAYIRSSETEDFLNNVNKMLSITNDLPFTYYKSAPVRQEDISFMIRIGDFQTCYGKRYCLLVEGTSNSTKELIFNTIREHGYDPEAYDIYFNGEKL